MTQSPPPKGTLRAATIDDCIEASALLTRLGLTMPEGADSIRAYFNNLWKINPAMQAAKSEPALGWVLEDADEMVGFFGNVPLLYEFDGNPVIVSDASLWGVHENFRSETPRLAEAYFGQTNVDLLLVTTAIKPTRRIFERFGASPVAQPDLDQVLYWVIDGTGFVRAGLRKKGQSGMASFFGGILGGMVLNARLRLGGRRPFAPLDGVTIIRPEEIDAGFDDLWRRKTREYPGRLLACRTAAALKWHFSVGRFSELTRVICFHRPGENGTRLEGYAVLVREDAPGIGLKRLKVADLFVVGDDEAIISALLTASYEYGLAQRCHVLEVVGLPENLRGCVKKHKPLQRQMPTFPFYFKAQNTNLEGPLASADGWYVSAYDGDTTLL
ncbi:MAG: hypothetical protein HN377_02320 [Alphaproteobacteria bacterium]|jgi:hypothetical protein|nr:hypothetical protein [Alphaproteobacteria bacterium]MBT7943268.1 hypothetical protein [Alphaproteobacteria bacterium]